MNEWLSAVEVGKMIGVSAMTVKRWCSLYSDYLNYQQDISDKKKYLINMDSLAVFKKISKLRKNNLQKQEIIKHLDNYGFFKVIDIVENNDLINVQNIGDEVYRIEKYYDDKYHHLEEKLDIVIKELENLKNNKRKFKWSFWK